MHHCILAEFFGKNVDLLVHGRSVRGTLTPFYTEDKAYYIEGATVVKVTPVEEWEQQLYSPTLVLVESVDAVHEIKPQPPLEFVYHGDGVNMQEITNDNETMHQYPPQPELRIKK